MKNLAMPKSMTGEGVITPTTRRVVIIGANGAGKSRFSRNVWRASSPDAVYLSAIDALYHNKTANSSDFIDARFMASAIPDSEKQREQTTLERLLSLLMHDELVNLLGAKLSALEERQRDVAEKSNGIGKSNGIEKNHGTEKKPSAEKHNATEKHRGTVALATTRLDRVIEIWQEIFPGNMVMVHNGSFLFQRPGSDDKYATKRLSDGERSVLFYTAAVLYAPAEANIIVEAPEMFLHPSTMQAVWTRLELLRPDCRFVYTTHDLEFAASRQGATFIWVRGWDAERDVFDYALIEQGSALSEAAYMSIMGARKPVLFIEGDASHSIDSKLYPLLFPDYTVKSVGSCNRVIEATRTFNDLSDFHHLKAMGIVDRDRRDDSEVKYLRRRGIMVPEVAEIENFFMLEEVIRAVAFHLGFDAHRVVRAVRTSVINGFKNNLRAQALEHTRHRIKKLVEYRVDGKFHSIREFEEHLNDLPAMLSPRELYDDFCRKFRGYVTAGDYKAILRVYNHKAMLTASNVAGQLRLSSPNKYINTVLNILAGGGDAASEIRAAALEVLGFRG